MHVHSTSLHFFDRHHFLQRRAGARMNVQGEATGVHDPRPEGGVLMVALVELRAGGMAPPALMGLRNG